ncbi:hypothetical protein HOK00_03555 [bacterium]|nr:hypothetical protein [bacterium]
MIKKIFILFLFFSFLHSVEISNSKTFEATSTSENLNIHFYFQFKHNNPTHIEHTFNIISTEVKSYNFCKGGAYSLNPFTYHTNTNKKETYSGRVDYNCIFNQSKDINKIQQLSSFLKHFSNKTPGLTISQSKMNREQNDLIEELENKAFEFSKKQLKRLNTFFFNCKILKIDFNNFNRKHRQPFAMDFKSSSIESMPMPINNKETKQYIKVDFLYNCTN